MPSPIPRFAPSSRGRRRQPADDVHELVRAACRFWKTPAFVYAGTNASLPQLPGIGLPARLRRPILVQLRDIRAETHAVHFDRFQLIDSDFA